MKKCLTFSAAILFAVGLAGCSNKAKTVEDNLVSFNKSSSYVVDVTKISIDNEDGTKDMKNMLGSHPHLEMNVDKKNKSFEVITKLKNNSSIGNVKILSDGKKVLMSTDYLVGVMSKELEDYKDKLEVPGLDKVKGSYMNIAETATTSELKPFKELVSNKNQVSRDKISNMLKDKKITENKKGYLTFKLNKNDIKKAIKNSDNTKEEKKEALNSIKDLSKLNVKISSKKGKMLVDMNTKEKGQSSVKIGMKIRNSNKSKKISMPDKSKILTSEELQQDLKVKMK